MCPPPRPADRGRHALGYKCSYNPTFAERVEDAPGWVSSGHYAIDQGPVVLMIENHRSGLVWRLMQSCPYIVDGLRAAGFAGGWLTGATSSRDST